MQEVHALLLVRMPQAYIDTDCGQGECSSRQRHAEVKSPKAMSLLQTNNVNMPGHYVECLRRVNAEGK